jgi:hypothetical protein
MLTRLCSRARVQTVPSSSGAAPWHVRRARAIEGNGRRLHRRVSRLTALTPEARTCIPSDSRTARSALPLQCVHLLADNHCVVLSCAVLLCRCAALCCAVLRCAALCCAVLCCAVLCRAVLQVWPHVALLRRPVMPLRTRRRRLARVAAHLLQGGAAALPDLPPPQRRRHATRGDLHGTPPPHPPWDPTLMTCQVCPHLSR